MTSGIYANIHFYVRAISLQWGGNCQIMKVFELNIPITQTTLLKKKDIKTKSCFLLGIVIKITTIRGPANSGNVENNFLVFNFFPPCHPHHH